MKIDPYCPLLSAVLPCCKAVLDVCFLARFAPSPRLLSRAKGRLWSFARLKVRQARSKSARIRFSLMAETTGFGQFCEAKYFRSFPKSCGICQQHKKCVCVCSAARKLINLKNRLEFSQDSLGQNFSSSVSESFSQIRVVTRYCLSQAKELGDFVRPNY